MNKRILIVAGLGVVLLVWFLSGWWTAQQDIVLVKETPLLRVAVHSSTAVQRTTELVIRGHTQANRNVTLRAEVAGPVDSIQVPKGATVEQGAEILTLDPEERRAQLVQEEAQLTQRRLQFEAVSKLGLKKFRSRTQLAQAEAQLREAEAELSRIRTTLQNTHVRAPFAGVIADRYVEVGDYVVVGDKLAMLVELDPLKVVASVAEQDVNHVRIGTSSRIRLASGEEVKGDVRFVGSVADPETRTFPIELSFANPAYKIRDGLTAEVYIPVKQVLAHHISPAILALNDAGQVGVKSVTAQSVVVFHPVTVIGHDDQGVWVTGLPKTVRLVVTGHDFVAVGQQVIAVSE